MAEQIEIIKQVKLTAAQRIALISAANNKGIVDASFDVRETLRYLGLVQQVPLHTKAEFDKEIADAWKALRKAVQEHDAKTAEDAVGIIRGERWRREKTCWRLTPAADEYLLKGRVIVTVGPKAEADVQRRLRA